MRVNIHELAAKEFYGARVKKDINFFYYEKREIRENITNTQNPFLYMRVYLY